MKMVKRRAWIALILAFALLFGMGVYVSRYATDGGRWVQIAANENLYENGCLLAGTVTDRSGTVLADITDGTRSYAADTLTRISCLHTVGDAEGNIGSGALRVMAERLSGYNPVTGVTTGGGEVQLSIDAQLCGLAYTALAGRKGAVLLADYSTGEIHCMVSSPSYDPMVGFDVSDPWYDSVYINRAIGAAYAPGSVFKLVTLAAAIENLDDLYTRSFSCTGSTIVDNSVVQCTGTHGSQTIEQALANSCNCAFAELSLALGGETLKKYADKLGFTDALSLSGIATAAGNFEAAPEGSAALAWSGIGQSTDLISPYAMLRYVSAVAAGGTFIEPTLLHGEPGGKTKLLASDTAQAIKAMMHYNVVNSYGEWNFPGLALCAKSGTAEVGDGTSHAWFTGFLDDPAHPYAFVVIIEHGGGGLRNAGEVANTLLQAAIEKDNAME